MNVLDSEWNYLKEGEETLFAERRKRKICEGTIGAIFLALALPSIYFSHFSFLAVYGQSDIAKRFIPFPVLYDYLDGLTSNDIMNGLAVSIGGALVLSTLGILIAILLRFFTKNIKGNAPSLCPENKNLDSAIGWAKALSKRHKSAPRILLRIFLISLLWIAAVTAVSCLLCKNGAEPNEAVLINGLIAVFEAAAYALAFGVLRSRGGVPKYEIYNADRFDAIVEELTKEKGERDKFHKCIQLFLEEKYNEAKALSKSFKDDESGDIAAIKILCTQELGETIQGLRKSYDSLWKAKDLGFVNDKIRQAVDFALNTITPVVMKEAEKDIQQSYEHSFNDLHGKVVLDCSKHADYGHPDAIVMKISGLVSMSKTTISTGACESWIRKLKMAKRRGLWALTEDLAKRLIERLEDDIRCNKEFEKMEEERQREAAKWAPTYGMGGTLSSWAEFSGWYDFRTGEPLYRVEGRIVNGNGEEVSPAWWE